MSERGRRGAGGGGSRARAREPEGAVVELPGGAPLRLRHVVMDFNGTLARDGRLLPGVRRRLDRLSRRFRLWVLTADTFGTARAALRSAPVALRPVGTGAEKRAFVARLPGAVAVGNGRNDVAMMGRAALGIAVLGPEGLAAELAGRADVVVARVEDALDLLLHPRRLTATLRR